MPVKSKQELSNLEKFKAKNEEVKRQARIKAEQEAKEARMYNVGRRKEVEDDRLNKEKEYEKQKYRKEHADELDSEILDKLDFQNLKRGDKKLIDEIQNERIRSRLQHEWNLQSSGFYKVVNDVNEPTNDEKVAGLWDSAIRLGLGAIPKVGEAVSDAFDATGIKAEAPKSKARESFNNAYSDLKEQYPELNDGPYQKNLQYITGGNLNDKVLCGNCGGVLIRKNYSKHCKSKSHLKYLST